MKERKDGMEQRHTGRENSCCSVESDRVGYMVGELRDQRGGHSTIPDTVEVRPPVNL